MAAGTDAGLFIYVIRIEPTENPSKVIQNALDIIDRGLKYGGGERLGAFQVIGENTLVILANGGVAKAHEELNKVYGKIIRTECNPVITYEDFARDTLKVDEEVLKFKPGKLGQKDGIYVWGTTEVEYEGKSVEELNRIWREECIATYAGMKKSNCPMMLYKIIGKRQVQHFSQVSDQRSLDIALMGGLPLFQIMGDQCCNTFKRIQLL